MITKIVLAALFLVGLHTVDDAFLQPPAGVSGSGHLFSGLIPLALLAVGAVVVLRAGRKLRILVVLAAAAWGAVGGTEALYALDHGDRLAHDDFTGLLSLAAGAALVILAPIIAVRGRNTQGRLTGRIARRTGATVGILSAVLLVMFPIGLAHVATHTSGPGLITAPDLGSPVTQVRLHTEDDLQLTAWYAPSRNGAAVIVVPGRSGHQHARMLARSGYGVLLLNRRGEGDSEGDPNLFGWGGDRDITAAIAFLTTRPEVKPGAIGALGLSVGGEMLLQHVAQHPAAPPDCAYPRAPHNTSTALPGLAAVVAEGAGSRSIRETLELSGGIRAAELSTAPLLTASLMILANQGVPPNLMSLLAERTPTPLLIVWGQRGQPAEIQFGPRYTAAAQPGAIAWEVPDASHTKGLQTDPALYRRKVVGFFDTALLADRQCSRAGRR